MKSLRILTWNILFEIRDAAPLRAGERHPALFDTLGEIGPDICALQELTPWSLGALRRRGGALLPGDAAWTEPYGVGLWSREPSLAHALARLPGGKPALWARYMALEAPIQVLAVHLSSDRHPDAAERRERELGAALTLLRPLEDAVVLGDINCGPGEYPAALAGFVDLWAMLRGQDPGPTWDPRVNALARATSKGGAPRRLDAIFWRPGGAWRPRAVERVQGRLDDGLPLSDHDGVLAEFERSG